MITNLDIAKLAKVLATKEDIKQVDSRLSRVEDVVNSHTTALDSLVKDVRDLKQENLAIKNHIGLIYADLK